MNESVMLDDTQEITPSSHTVEDIPAPATPVIIHCSDGSYGLIRTLDCLVTSATLNVRSKKDLAAALPYALEDQLAVPVESLHFVAGEESENGTRPVIVAAHEKISEWLADVTQRPDYLIPDALALPFEENCWTVVIAHERALVRCGRCNGFECRTDNLAEHLALCLKNTDAPEYIDLWYAPSDVIPQLPAETGYRMRMHNMEASFNLWLNRNADPVKGLNLLDGKYARGVGGNGAFRPWLPAAVILVLALLLDTGMTMKSISEAEQRIIEIENMTGTLFRDAFPDVQRVVNPHIQAEQGLRALRDRVTAPGGGFFTLFVDTMNAVRDFPSMDVNSLNWQNNYLQLQITADDVSDVEKLESILIDKRYAVEIINAVNRDGRFRARLGIGRREP